MNPIKPNQADDKTIQDYLLQRGKTAFRRFAGYQPPTIQDLDSIKFHFPISEQPAKYSRKLMNRMSSEPIPEYNPAMPYVLMIWLWFSTDSTYSFWEEKMARQIHILKYIVNVFEILSGERQVALESFFITDPSFRIRQLALKIAIPQTDKTLHFELENNTAFAETFNAIEEFTFSQGLRWSTLTDEELLSELRPLFLTFYDKICEYNADEK